MYLVGLTGGIASGKSTLATRWVGSGAVEIDADVLAREVIARGTPGLDQVRAEFGDEVFDEDGQLNRRALAAVVFQEPTKRALLEQIIHPLVRKRSAELLASMAQDAIVIYNVPLLVEAEVKMPFDKIVTVEAPEQVQIERLVKNRGMTRAEAASRIAAQATAPQRAAKAHIILNTDKPMDQLLKEADLIWLDIKREAKAKQNA
jgi:dephospho-CoA kinase